MERLIVDEPHYCPECGSQFYVSGGNVLIESTGQKVFAFDIETQTGKVFHFEDPVCPSCKAPLLPLRYLEEVFGELRTF